MRTKKYDGSQLRRVLVGMITDKKVCSRISSQWQDGGLFADSWANMIALWCVQHLEKYSEPPGKNITDIFTDWSEKSTTDKDTAASVERFLEDMSESFDPDSPESSNYVLDVAGQHFNTVQIRAAIDEAQEQLLIGKAGNAAEVLNQIRRVELGIGSWTNPGDDWDGWLAAFEKDEEKALLKFPGRLNAFFAGMMQRSSFVALMAPDKTGKSFWLLDLAARTTKARRRVAFFDAGDMTKEDVYLRLGQRACGLPLVSNEYNYPKGFNDEGAVVLEQRRPDTLLSATAAYKGVRRMTRNKDLLRISCHSNSTLSVEKIATILENWAREGWVPDVVVIDYADIMDPPRLSQDKNDQIDDLWKHLRRLSQDYDCLVLTATQTNAEAYRGGLLTRRNFSGRKTKLAHVNGMFGLNISEEQKRDGITAVNWIVRRKGNWPETQTVQVAGCLALARPVIYSK